MSVDEGHSVLNRGRTASNASTGDIEFNESENILNGPHMERFSGSQYQLVNQENAVPIRNATKKGCCNSFATWFSLFLTLAMAVSLIAMKLESDQRHVALQKQVIDLQRQLKEVSATEAYNFHVLQDNLLNKEAEFESQTQANLAGLADAVFSQNRSIVNHYHNVWEKLLTHDASLIKLTNGTSNAEVLDKLQLTRQQVSSEMMKTKAEVSNHLQDITNNVTLIIEENTAQLQQTKTSISTYLNSTVYNMRSVMATATNHIFEVQRNVTRAMNQTKANVERTVIDLSASVLKAQATIQEEVAEVRDHIEAYVAVTNKQFAAENDFVKYQLAGLFTLLSCLIFLWHLTSHMRHFYKPDIQKRITAILWMVPVYGVTSWISMMQPKAENYLATVRDCYEAYVVYTFVAMLVAILGDGKSLDELEIQIANRIAEERRDVMAYKAWQAQQRAANAANSANAATAMVATTVSVVDVENNALSDLNDTSEPTEELLPTAPTAPLREPKEHFIPPCPCCYRNHLPLSMAATWLWQCRFLALQFMFVKPLLTFIPVLLQITGLYNVDEIPPWENNAVNWHSAKLYIIVIQNVSVGMAFYGLLSFYHGAEKDLEWCDPWPKFLTIKGIVFATFWQSICIQGMSAFGLVDEKAALQISNFLICVEMLIASIAHFYVFPYHEWHPTYQKQRERTLLIQDTMALRDFVQDMRTMMTSRRVGSRSGGELLDENGIAAHENVSEVDQDASRDKSLLLMTGKDTELVNGGSERDSEISDENDGDEENEETGVSMSLLHHKNRHAHQLPQQQQQQMLKAAVPLVRKHSRSKHHDGVMNNHDEMIDDTLRARTATTAEDDDTATGYGVLRGSLSTFNSNSTNVSPAPTSRQARASPPLTNPHSHLSSIQQRETDPLLLLTEQHQHHFHHHQQQHPISTPHRHHTITTPHHHRNNHDSNNGGVDRYVQQQLEKKLQMLEAIDASSSVNISASAPTSNHMHMHHSTPTSSAPPRSYQASPPYYQQGGAATVINSSNLTPDIMSPLHSQENVTLPPPDASTTHAISSSTAPTIIEDSEHESV